MSIRAQREQLRKLSIKDKKLARLFFNKNIVDNDLEFIGYVYEERQNQNFFYGGAFCQVVPICLNFALFKHNTFTFQMLFTGTSFMVGHFLTKRMIEFRFNKLIDPYFEKYEIK